MKPNVVEQAKKIMLELEGNQQQQLGTEPYANEAAGGDEEQAEDAQKKMVKFGTDIVNGSSYKPLGSPQYSKKPSNTDILSENGGGGVASEVGSNMSGSSKRMTRKERMDRRMSMVNHPKSNEENRLPTDKSGLPPRFGR